VCVRACVLSSPSLFPYSAPACVSDDREPRRNTMSDPSKAANLETANEFYKMFSDSKLGMALEVQSTYNQVVVKRCVPGSASERAGIPPGVLLLEVNGTLLEQRSLQEVQQLLQKADRPARLKFAQTDASRLLVAQQLKKLPKTSAADAEAAAKAEVAHAAWARENDAPGKEEAWARANAAVWGAQHKKRQEQEEAALAAPEAPTEPLRLDLYRGDLPGANELRVGRLTLTVRGW
jgi:hypothetical protein